MSIDPDYFDPTNKYVQAYTEIVPEDVRALGTPESELLWEAYQSNGYWLSELYAYIPNLRSTMRKVLRQLNKR